jgi:hypothetical protein
VHEYGLKTGDVPEAQQMALCIRGLAQGLAGGHGSEAILAIQKTKMKLSGRGGFM